MKKLLFAAMLLASVIVVPIPTMAAVDIHIGFPPPPPIVFRAPIEVIVIPETYVYVVPDIDVDLFFWNGWWWRLWEGRWYRSHYYSRGWGYYDNVPSFYFDVDPGWRRHYRDHDWYGHRWSYERIPYQRLQQNWKGWQNNRHWERRGTWGVQNYQRRPQAQRQESRRQWQEQYHQKPEVQRHQQERERQRKPQVEQQRKPPVQQQGKPQVEQQRKPPVQQQERKPQVEQQRKPPVQQQQRKPQVEQPQHSQPQGKPERGEIENRDRK